MKGHITDRVIRTILTSVAAAMMVPGFAGAVRAAESSPPSPRSGAVNSGQSIAELAVFPAVDSDTVRELVGPDSGSQIIVTASMAGGGVRDLTRECEFRVEPAGIVAIDSTGWVTPLKNGVAEIVAGHSGDVSAVTRVRVREVRSPQRVSFANEVVPVFTKLGCNGGGCHGKSGGQNGFRLSLLGFEPGEDYDHLVRESRGRRLFPAAPDHSLLLLKGTGKLPHGGGARLEEDSYEYNLMRRWIEQGMPATRPDDPRLERLEVYPAERLLEQGAEQQLVVTAFYSDGTTRDVTRVVQYESNNKEMAEAERTGLVRIGSLTGDVAVMVRFQEQASVFRGIVPLGAPLGEFPPAANFVDELVYKKLRLLGVPPSEPSDDTTFLRRTALDIAGRLPAPDETRAFLADSTPVEEKRARWVATLLDSADYADFFAGKWSAILRNKRSKATYQRGTFAFHAWIRDGLYANKPYDRMLRELITASGDIGQNPPVAWYRSVSETEDRMQDIAQVFLGVRLQCARCHHHPFEQWSQRDYYGFAAFFTQVSRKPGLQPGEEFIVHQTGVSTARNPKTKRDVPPTGLGADSFRINPEEDPREALADWMTRPENPFFAKMLVNRYWKHFFGRGLVEPEDDLRATNPPTNPELLDALALHFTETGYDLKELVRTICTSNVYQLSSLPNRHNGDDRQNFSRYYPKRLPAEVLLDAIGDLTGVPTKFSGLPLGTRATQLPDNQYNSDSYFLTIFGRPDMDSACECERTDDANLAQSLHLLNSKGLQEKLTDDRGRAARLASDTERSDAEKIRDLYLLGYSREPLPDEIALATEYIARKRASVPVGNDEVKDAGADADAEVAKRSREAFEDLVWAMINSKEFLFNH